MASSFRANADGTTSVLNGSGTEVVKFPSTAGVNTTVATLGDTIGVGQTWQDVTASRASGVTYTNSTGKPIFIEIFFDVCVYTYTHAGITSGSLGGAGDRNIHQILVPNNDTYKITVSSGSIQKWIELR